MSGQPMVQAPSPRSPTEQHFTHSVLTWEDFKTLQAVLAPSGVRVSYCHGEVELLTVSDLHGLIAGNLGYLLEMYMLENLVRFIGLEDFSIEVPTAASAQADKAYCFDQRKPIPDLAVEVVITGERETKLTRYAALQVSEVWFWIDHQIRVYQLTREGDAMPPMPKVIGYPTWIYSGLRRLRPKSSGWMLFKHSRHKRRRSPGDCSPRSNRVQRVRPRV